MGKQPVAQLECLGVVSRAHKVDELARRTIPVGRGTPDATDGFVGQFLQDVIDVGASPFGTAV